MHQGCYLRICGKLTLCGTLISQSDELSPSDTTPSTAGQSNESLKVTGSCPTGHSDLQNNNHNLHLKVNVIIIGMNQSVLVFTNTM